MFRENGSLGDFHFPRLSNLETNFDQHFMPSGTEPLMDKWGGGRWPGHISQMFCRSTRKLQINAKHDDKDMFVFDYYITIAFAPCFNADKHITIQLQVYESSISNTHDLIMPSWTPGARLEHKGLRKVVMPGCLFAMFSRSIVFQWLMAQNIIGES